MIFLQLLGQVGPPELSFQCSKTSCSLNPDRVAVLDEHNIVARLDAEPISECFRNHNLALGAHSSGHTSQYNRSYGCEMSARADATASCAFSVVAGPTLFG